MAEKLKNIPYWVYDTLSIVSAIVTIVTAIVAFFNAIVTVETLKDGTYVVSYNKILAFICVLLVLFVVICVIKIRKYGNILRHIKSDFPKNYYMFLHDFRNVYFEILKGHKSNNILDQDTRVEVLTKDTKNFLVNALDYLCDLMEKNTGRKVCASIKLIENTGMATNIDKDTATVITFCRSKNSDSKRKANDERNNSIKVKENTDFYDILDENSQNADAFYQSDLLQYAKYLKKDGRAYRNTTLNYENFYRGTIVVPIRVARQKLYYVSENQGYDIIGFLCIDSIYTDAFRNNDFDKTNYINIVKSFAAEMYIILNKYNFYLQKIIAGGP